MRRQRFRGFHFLSRCPLWTRLAAVGVLARERQRAKEKKKRQAAEKALAAKAQQKADAAKRHAEAVRARDGSTALRVAADEDPQ